MRYEETPLRRRIIDAAGNLPYSARICSTLERPSIRANQAAYAFYALQDSASNAVLTLISMLTNSSHQATAMKAATALSYIGIPSVPALVEIISDHRLPNRELAVTALGLVENLGTNGLPAVPVLLRELNGGPSFVSPEKVIVALGRLTLEPEISVPALVRALEVSADFKTRYEVECALMAFHEKAKCAIPALLRTREVEADPGERAFIDLVLEDIDPAYVPKPDATDSQ
jgi:HEAT repeat protein